LGGQAARPESRGSRGCRGGYLHGWFASHRRRPPCSSSPLPRGHFSVAQGRSVSLVSPGVSGPPAPSVSHRVAQCRLCRWGCLGPGPPSVSHRVAQCRLCRWGGCLGPAPPSVSHRVAQCRLCRWGGCRPGHRETFAERASLSRGGGGHYMCTWLFYTYRLAGPRCVQTQQTTHMHTAPSPPPHPSPPAPPGPSLEGGYLNTAGCKIWL
jgi:hypothetical protein